MSQSPLDHDQPPPDPQPSQSNPDLTMKTYNMYYTTSRTNVKLHLGSSSSPCLYYGETGFLSTMTKPQIQLRAGDSKSAPMVAFAKVFYTSRHIKLGTGDYQRGPEDQLVWEEMRRKRLRLLRSDYEFDYTSDAGRGGSRRTYGWRVEKHYMKTLYKCVDDVGQVVASLRSGGVYNWSKGAEVDVADGLEPRLEHLLIVGALAIFTVEAGWSFFQGYKGGQGSAHGDPSKVTD